MRVPHEITRRGGSIEIMLTPMIDVVFQLMIFFVWTSSFDVPEYLLPASLLATGGAGSTLDVPAESPDPDLDRVVVMMYWSDAGVTWTVNGVAAPDLASVRQKLAAVARISTNVPVLIDPQDAVPLRHVIDVYDAARQAGFDRVQLAAGP